MGRKLCWYLSTSTPRGREWKTAAKESRFYTHFFVKHYQNCSGNNRGGKRQGNFCILRSLYVRERRAGNGNIDDNKDWSLLRNFCGLLHSLQNEKNDANVQKRLGICEYVSGSLLCFLADWVSFSVFQRVSLGFRPRPSLVLFSNLAPLPATVAKRLKRNKKQLRLRTETRSGEKRNAKGKEKNTC